MSASVKRQRRITDLFKYAVRLAQDDTMTPDGIKRAVFQRALLIVSKGTAIEYTDSVFQMIDRVRNQQ